MLLLSKHQNKPASDSHSPQSLLFAGEARTSKEGGGEEAGEEEGEGENDENQMIKNFHRVSTWICDDEKSDDVME